MSSHITSLPDWHFAHKLGVLKHTLDSDFDSEFSKYGVVREQTENEIIIEVEKNQIKDITQELLSKYAVSDFSIQDIPIEEGIALLYSSC